MVTRGLDPDAAGFIRFCLDRKGNCWPALYDEMCLVAGQRLYKGMGYDDLSKKGLSLALGNFSKLTKVIELVHKESMLEKNVR